jgi:hypothetical protein
MIDDALMLAWALDLVCKVKFELCEFVIWKGLDEKHAVIKVRASWASW